MKKRVNDSRKNKKDKKKSAINKIVCMLFVMLFVVWMIISFGNLRLLESDVYGGTLEVHFLDVGQADCILVEQNGIFMLIDAGNNEDEEVILQYLNKLGVKRLEYVIGTHPHEDHIGSLDAVIRNIEIGQVILPKKEHTTRTFENLLNAIAETNCILTPARALEQYQLNAAEFTILSPNKDYGEDLNNWSVGIRLTYGETAFVLCADAEEEAEQDIIDTAAVLNADVLKAGHHGSSTSNSLEFLKAVSPEYLVISCGVDNPYGHPHKETIEKAKEYGIKVFRTDTMGTIVAVSDGSKVSMLTQR